LGNGRESTKETEAKGKEIKVLFQKILREELIRW